MIKPTKINLAIAIGFILALALFVYGVILSATLFPADTNIGDLDTLKALTFLLAGGLGCMLSGVELYERHHDRIQGIFYQFRNEGEPE